MKWDRQMRRCSCFPGSLSCCAMSGGSCARRYMAKVSCVENCASYSFACRVRLRPSFASKARTCYQTVCKPSLQHLILVRCCSCHASSGSASAPAPVNCRLSWGSTLALAVIKRLNNASCLIIIYDTRRCRLLPEKPAGTAGGGRGTWQDWKTL